MDGAQGMLEEKAKDRCADKVLSRAELMYHFQIIVPHSSEGSPYYAPEAL
jgi:hypothetical protein